MAVTITSGSSTFTFNDGDVDGVDADVQSEIDVIPSPGTGAEDAYLSDINGVTKKLTITGSLTEAASTRVSGDSITTIAQQKAWLEALQNGSQSPMAFTSTYENCNVMVEKMSFREAAGEPNILPFTISLVVGSE